MFKRLKSLAGAAAGKTAAVFLIMLLMSACVIFLIEKNRQAREQEQMKYIAKSVVAETYETMSGYLSRTRILEAFIIQNKDEIKNFDKIAAMLTEEGPVRNVLFAPNGVVSYVYPLSGNENLIGYDLKGAGAGNKEAVAAINSGEMIMAGPFPLMQGGLGIAGRLPVFIDKPGGGKEFWGIVSVTLNYPEVLDNAYFDNITKQGFSCELWRINADSGERQVIMRTEGSPLRRGSVLNETYRIYNSEWFISVSPSALWYEHFVFWLSVVLGVLFSFLVALAADNYSRIKAMKNEFQLAAMQWSKITFIFDYFKGTFSFLNFGEPNKGIEAAQDGPFSWDAAIHPDDADKDIKLREEIKKGAVRAETDVRLMAAGGKDYRWYHYIAAVIPDRSGKPEKMLGTLSDIEETYNVISELRRQIEHDQTEVLLTQISSHFFYHTLNAIQALIVLDPECAIKMISDFSRYLRYRIDSVAAKNGLVTFKEEMRSVAAYVDINIIQLGYRLNVVYDLGAEDFMIPVLTVQPIVENAINHGIKPKAGGGTIKIKAVETADGYEVTVLDDGVGFMPEKSSKSTSIGMHNILTRLGRYKGCSVSTSSQIGRGTKVKLKFPKKMEMLNENNTR